MKRTLLTVILALGALLGARAQEVALKTNLLSDAALSPNLGVEVKLAPQWTLDLTGQVNAWHVGDRRWKHWLVQPEARYWWCEAFSGHFVAAHLIGGQYNWGNLRLPDFLGSDLSRLRDKRFQGWGAGLGVAYGYAWILDKHWNFEAEIGLGWIYTRYDEFNCQGCGRRIKENKPHNYVGPTKAALNIVYLF